MRLTSPEFEDNEKIPSKFTCQGEDINPELHIDGVPEGAKSLVLLMEDPDAPTGTFDHWICYNIPPESSSIMEDAEPGNQGMNSFGRQEYGGPCPPSGEHRYIFTLYALDTELSLVPGASKADVKDAMDGHVLEEAKLTGLYSKS